MLHLLEFIILELISVQEYWFITTDEYFAFQNYEVDMRKIYGKYVTNGKNKDYIAETIWTFEILFAVVMSTMWSPIWEKFSTMTYVKRTL